MWLSVFTRDEPVPHLWHCAQMCGRAWMEDPAVWQCLLLLMPRAFPISSPVQLGKVHSCQGRPRGPRSCSRRFLGAWFLEPGSQWASTDVHRMGTVCFLSLGALEKYPESWCWRLIQKEGTAPGQQSSEVEHAGASVPSSSLIWGADADCEPCWGWCHAWLLLLQAAV